MSASFPGAVKTFTTRSAGQTIGSAHINDLQDEVNAIEASLITGPTPAAMASLVATAISPAWTSYTPTWAGSGGNPAIGNGSLAGAYLQIGKLVFVKINMKMGSTTTYGSGAWTWSLPVTAVSLGAVTEVTIGAGKYLDSGTTHANFIVTLSTTTTLKAHQQPDAGSGFNATTPITWATNDEISMTGVYEAA